MSCERMWLSLLGKANPEKIELSSLGIRTQRDSWGRSGTRFLGALAATALWICLSAGAASPPPMAVPGQFNVGATGAATYSIPIAVPPGTSGMVPGLSLDYSSQGSNGYVGALWSLDGLPSITRCARGVQEDGVHGAINYDSNDRFCLNGQRLMVINGTYGASGSEYRTEVDSFSKVLAYGSAGNGPSYFKIWTKDGQIFELGNTTDSKVLAVGNSSVRVWAANKVSDTKNNYYTVTYTNDTTNGQVYPARIDYTGNANAGLTPYNSVQFFYTSRPDVVPTYQAGSLNQMTVLLTDIKAYQGSNVVSDYQLGYRTGSSTTHSRLTSVTRCDGSGNCLAPTTFTWQGGNGLPSMTSTANSVAQGKLLQAGDFNGDGLTDLLAGTNFATSCTSGGFIYFGSQSGSFSSGNINMGYTYWPAPKHTRTYYSGAACYYKVQGSLVGDLNGDGYSDLLLENVYWYYDSVAAEWVPNPVSNELFNNQQGYLTEQNLNTSLPQFTLVGDFNGDGRTDGFAQTSATAGTPYFGNGDGTFTAGTSITGLGTNSGVLAADFDGDGCTDFLAQGGTNAMFYSCSPTASSVSVPNWSGSSIYLGDFNGDGKTDILVIGSSGATLYLSTGKGLSAGYAIPGSSGWANYAVITGDWDGDGKTDIALISHTSGSPHLIYLSTGTGFTQASSIANSGTDATAVVADWNNDGASDIWLQRSAGDTQYSFSYVPELMTGISNGIAATTTITYDRLNKNGSFYTKGTSPGYPTLQLDGPYYVVSEVDASNGVGGTYVQTYSYTGAFGNANSYVYSNQGGDLFHGFVDTSSAARQAGLMGFTQISVSDPQTNIVTTTSYSSTYPYVGMVTSQTRTHSGTTISSVSNTLENVALGGGRYFVGVHQSVVAGSDLNGTALPTTTTTTTYDCDSTTTCYGNATQVVASVSDGSSKTTTSSYANDTTNWFLGELTSAVVQSVVGSSNITRTTCFQYDASSGLVTRQVLEPVSTSNCTYSANGLQTDIALDPYGHQTQVTVSGPNITTRSTTASFDGLGEFQTGDCDALNECEILSYDPRFGLPATRTDANGITTSWTYDSFGRLALATMPDGNRTAMSYAYCSGINGGSSSCVSNGTFLSTATPQNGSGGQNGAQSVAYYDALYRGIASDSQGFDTSWIRSSVQYDAKGRVQQASRPYFTSGGTPQWTGYLYDDLGRATQQTLPNGRVDTFSYNGLTRSVTIASGSKNQTTSTTRNAQSLNASVTDASGTTSFVYDAFGNATSVTDPAGNVITNVYNIRGYKTDSYDPDMGHWTYAANALGQLTSQRDAKGQTTSLSYDLAGRPLNRTENNFYSAWTYGNSSGNHNVGQPVEAKSCTDSSCSSVIADKTFAYDGYGRPSSNALSIDGTNYSYAQGYDANGRLATLSYPSGFAAQYAYTSSGYLSQIKDNSSGAAYWTTNSRDAEQHILSQTYGINAIGQSNTYDASTGLPTAFRAGPSDGVAAFDYSWDNVGNLTYRSDNHQGTFEYACYDTLNRLTEYAAGNGVTACSSSQNHTVVGYNALGNITSKSDVGSYGYPSAGQVLPHAVSSISGTVNGVANPSYSYDSNGNMTAGAGRSVSYTAFNMANTITQGSSVVSLAFDSEHSRVKMTAPSGTTYYLNDPATGVMSEKLVSGGSTTWHDYMLGDGRIVAEKFSGATSVVRYVVADHLGSTASVTDESGNVVERDAYDPWGKRRNLDGSADTSCGLTSLTTRGFTGHEHIDSQCLINANARIYDPTIGRFMSADDIIPDPTSGQSYNRFSYVSNGPLSASDPTGHAGDINEIVNAIKNWIDGPDPHPQSPIQMPSSSVGLQGGNGGAGGGGVQESVTVTGVRPPVQKPKPRKILLLRPTVTNSSNQCPVGAIASAARWTMRQGANVQAAGDYITVSAGTVTLGAAVTGQEYAVPFLAGATAFGATTSTVGFGGQLFAGAVLYAKGDPRPLVSTIISQALGGPPSVPGKGPTDSVADKLTNALMPNAPHC